MIVLDVFNNIYSSGSYKDILIGFIKYGRINAMGDKKNKAL